MDTNYKIYVLLSLVRVAQRPTRLNYVSNALFLRHVSGEKRIGCLSTHKNFQLWKATFGLAVPNKLLATLMREPDAESSRRVLTISGQERDGGNRRWREREEQLGLHPCRSMQPGIRGSHTFSGLIG
jgi:hypothetical protein